MSVIHIDFNETTDVYLQILRDAQFVEDKKLILMVKDRLRNNGHHAGGMLPAGEIIPFPCSASPVGFLNEEIPLMHKTGYPQLLIIVLVYFILSSVFLLIP